MDIDHLKPCPDFMEGPPREKSTFSTYEVAKPMAASLASAC